MDSLLIFLTHLVAMGALAVAVLAASVPNKVKLPLASTIISLLAWQDTVYVSNRATSLVHVWDQLSFVWPTVAVISFFLFMYQLSEYRRWKISNQTVLKQYLPIIMVSVGTILQSIAIAGGRIYSSSGQIVERGWGYGVYIVGIGFALLGLVFFVWLARHQARATRQTKRSINIIMYTVLLASIYGLLLNVLIPVFFNTQAYDIFGILVVDIFAIGLAHSVINAKLLDVKLYVIRSLGYLLAVATLLLVYGILAVIASQTVLDTTYTSAQQVFNILMVLVLALVFQPIRQFFDRITSRIFFREDYDSSVFFEKLNRILGGTQDMRRLLERVADYVSQTLRAKRAVFFLYQADKAPLVVSVPVKSVFARQDAKILDDYFTNRRESVLAVDSVVDDSVRRLLVSYKIGIVLALRNTDGPLGYLMLGEHLAGGYSRRDMRVLRAMTDELVIAIQHALSIKEIKDLNANLEQRVRLATKELRSSNAQLQKLDEAKDEFISMASHQLRTPLTSIKGYLSMLMEGDVGPVSDEQSKLLREAFISSERMVRLIGDFLNVSRLQTGKFIIDRHPVNLSKLVADEIEALETNAAARGLKFKYKAPKSFPTMNLDVNKIQQVIMNFSDNAIFYSKPKTVINVELKEVDGWAEFTVTDHGIGVPLAQQNQLFNKFFRATNARRQRPDGTGVGLFLAKKVIDAHGGRIIFRSKEDQGSTFGFRLPIK